MGQRVVSHLVSPFFKSSMGGVHMLSSLRKSGPVIILQRGEFNSEVNGKVPYI